jgi:uncharacterized membrane protein
MASRAQWESTVQRLRTSLWLVPIAAVTGAMALAILLPRADRRWGADVTAWYLYAGQADSARELLSTIASSMLTLAALVFSITILVLQLASSQFSPRVLRTFLTDRTTQVALGMFLGSFVYPMVLLPQVRSGEHEVVPAFSVFFAIALVLLSILTFVRYIHHMAHSIRAASVLKRVADETRDSVRALYPDVGDDDPMPALHAPDRPADHVLLAKQAGVLSAVDAEELLARAMRHDLVIELHPCVGDFVPCGAPIMSVWGKDGDELEQALRDACVIASERTPTQDVAFGLRQLVDVAERALSPGVNDPTTAVQALDHIHDLLRSLCTRKFPSPVRSDEQGRLRLLLPRPDFASLVRLSLDEIRHYGAGSIQIMRRMRALLDDLLRTAPPVRRGVLVEQLRLLDVVLEKNFRDAAELRVASSPSAQGHGMERGRLSALPRR